MLRIDRVETARDLSDFIAVPKRVYVRDPVWRAPLDFERKQHLSPKHNPALARMEHAMWVARADGAPTGRITAQIDPVLTGTRGPIGQFGFLEAIEDEAVWKALTGTAEAWLAKRGAAQMEGPFNWSINQECGMLVDGFDTPPQVMMPHGRPYYAAMMERLGYEKAADTVAYRYLNGRPETGATRKMRDWAAQNPSLRLRYADMKHFEAEVRTALALFNDGWSGNWGYIPFTDEEIAAAAGEMKPILHARSAVFAEIDGEPVCFALLLPDVNELARGLNGKLLPLGWAKLLYRLKAAPVRRGRVPLFGLSKKVQKSRIGSLVAFVVLDRLAADHEARGMQEAELSWILDTNTAMRRLIDHFGADAYKTYRIWRKELAA